MTCTNPDHPKKAHAHQTEAGDFVCTLHTMMVGEDDKKGGRRWSCVTSRCQAKAYIAADGSVKS